ncbi:hypothetical protein [Prauserella endophytica]|uniref:Uncharacterized protein n=1 Tax=Prauserella endophytica TaxID=1592324 RepID=A0ABY2S2A2_9PSEU|nr:hypothetical protein [Prauserella endophytica]PXY20355.1 hypothetical protein BAY59_31450 [Prauserella coralliicola]TKG66957.1 hypothetical protein FCN18_23895 [Prauserella endophytica]
MSTTTEYATPGTTRDLAVGQLSHVPGVDLHYVAPGEIDAEQCENCGYVGAVVEARVCGPARTDLYAEVCISRGCAESVARFHTEQGDGDVIVEIAGEPN